VTYKNNSKAGTATAVITGTGNYTGTVKQDFTIKKVTSFSGNSSYQKTYGNGAFVLDTKQKSGDGKLTYQSSDTSVAKVDKNGKVTLTGVGTAKITVTAAETSQYRPAVTTVTVTVGLGATKLTSATSQKKGISLKWKTVKGAQGYYVYRRTQKTSYRKIATVKGASKVSYLDKTRKASTKYYYMVQAYNKKTVSTSVVSDVGAMYVKTPSGLSLSQKKAKTLKAAWSSVSGVSGYQIACASSASMKNKKLYTIRGSKQKASLLTGLKKGKTYYIRIRAYKTSGKNVYYSEWSSTKKHKIKK
jgi:hypothetical protein